MKFLRASFLFVSLAFLAKAQPPQRVIFVNSDPSGSCTNGQALEWNATSGNFWGCNAGTWTKLNGSGGGSITTQTNGTNNLSQTTLNIQNGTNTAASNPSGGNVQVSVPTATSSALGVVKPDNSTITISGGVISSTGGSGTVTSITLNGTTNQITLTGTCTSTTAVTCTFSLPSNVVLPGTINSLTITTSTGTLTIANAKTLTVNNSVTWTGTDGSTLQFGSGGTIFYTSTTLGCSQMPVLTTDVSNTNCALTVIGVNGAAVPTSATVLGSNSSKQLVADTTTGTGNVVLATAPTMTNPVVGTQIATDNSTKAASTAYVTTGIANAVAGINPAIAVQYATTAAGDTSSLTYNNGVSGIGATMTGANNIVTTIDGHAFVVGDVGITRLLIKNDTQSPSGAFNGVYLFTALHTAGTGDIFTRAVDYDAPSDINNTGIIPVINGTSNTTTTWVITSNVTTVGTDPLTYSKFSSNPSSIVTSVTGTAPIVSSGGTTPAISINDATSSAKGAVQTDGSTISVSSGTISCTTATTSQLGCIKPDGTSITISGGVITSTSSCMATTTQTLGSTAASFTFSSIPATCNTLVIDFSLAASTTGVNMYLQANGDTAAHYYEIQVGTGGAGTPSTGLTSGATPTIVGISSTTYTNPSVGQIIIPNYTGSTYNKGGVTTWIDQYATGNPSTSNAFLSVNGWYWVATTPAAITQLVFGASSSTFAAGSSITLSGR